MEKKSNKKEEKPIDGKMMNTTRVRWVSAEISRGGGTCPFLEGFVCIFLKLKPNSKFLPPSTPLLIACGFAIICLFDLCSPKILLPPPGQILQARSC